MQGEKQNDKNMEKNVGKNDEIERGTAHAEADNQPLRSLSAASELRKERRAGGSAKRNIGIAAAALLTAALVFALALIFVPKAAAPGGDDAGAGGETVNKDLTKFDREDLKDIRLTTESGAITVYLDGDTWKVREMPHATINQEKALSLARLAAWLTYEDMIEENPADLAPYGLEKPKSTAVITLKNGESYTLYLGNSLVGNTKYYLMKEGVNTVYTVWVNAGDGLSHTLSSLRDIIIPAVNASALIKVHVEKRGEPTIDMFIDDPESMTTVALWKLTEPYPVDGEWESCETYAQAAGGITATRFLEDMESADGMKYGFDAPYARVSVGDDYGVNYDIVVGNMMDDLYYYAHLADSQEVFLVEKSKLSFLSTRPISLVNRFVNIVGVTGVDKIEMIVGDAVHTITATSAPAKKADGTPELDLNGNQVISYTYYLDGAVLQDKAFKTFYQELIGVKIDAEHKGGEAQDTSLTVKYYLNGKPAPDLIIEYAPLDRDYSLVTRNGQTYFTVLSERVDKLIIMLEDLRAGRLNS